MTVTPTKEHIEAERINASKIWQNMGFGNDRFGHIGALSEALAIVRLEGESKGRAQMEAENERLALKITEMNNALGAALEWLDPAETPAGLLHQIRSARVVSGQDDAGTDVKPNDLLAAWDRYWSDDPDVREVEIDAEIRKAAKEMEELIHDNARLVKTTADLATECERLRGIIIKALGHLRNFDGINRALETLE